MPDPVTPPTETPGANPTPPAPANPPAPAEPAGFDPKVLESPELWKQPRIAELLQAQKDLKALQSQQDKQTEATLTEQKKFEELAAKRADELAARDSQINTMRTDQALTNVLIKESVIDLNAALKLVDRSKLSIDDSGQVQGVDQALAALKTDSPYLFTTQPAGQPPKVGNPSNPGNPNPGAPMKFKASQFVGIEGSAFYRANKAEVDAAYKAGLVEDDIYGQPSR